MAINIDLPDGVDVRQTDEGYLFSGPEGEVTRELSHPDIDLEITDDSVILKPRNNRRKTNATLGSIESHIENALHGVSEGFTYRMKVLYSHFPMQVDVKGDIVEVRNFLGEKHPRETEVIGDTEVEVRDEEVVLRGPDKEHVGQTAANIEQLTYINEKDIRVFQDGIYITEKPSA